MRKIIVASAVGLALIAGQAIAANGAAQSLQAPSLQAGDRVGASLGAQEDAFGLVALGSWLASMGPVLATVVVLGTTYAVIEIADAISDDDDSPSN